MSKKEYKNEKFEVMYNTDFRKIPLHSFFPVERNFLMGICTKLKKQGTDVVEFTFDELKELTHWSKKNDKLFVENLKNTNEKLMSLKNTVKMGNITIQFVLFPLFKIDEDKQTLKVRVLKEFSYLLNDFDKFTSFDIEIYSLLSSSYSKTLFEELMNFKPKGIRNFKMEDFRKFLNIPVSYRMSNIDQKVLNPIKEDFKEHFIFFEIEKVKKGRTITNIIFKFEFKNIVYKKIEDKSNIEEAEIIKIKPNDEEMDKEELRAFFIDKFTSNGIIWTKPIKESLFKTLKKIGLKETEKYLIELWENIKNEPKAKDKIGLFVDYIKREERKVNTEEIEEYWDRATPYNIYQPRIFNEKEKEIKSIKEIQKVEEKKVIKVSKEKYEAELKEYMKKNDITERKLCEFIFQKITHFEIEEENKKDDDFTSPGTPGEDPKETAPESETKNTEIKEKYNKEYVKKSILLSLKREKDKKSITVKDEFYTRSFNQIEKVFERAYEIVDTKLFRDLLLDEEYERLLDRYTEEITKAYNIHFGQGFIQTAKNVREVNLKTYKENLETLEEKIEYIKNNLEKYADDLLSKAGKKLTGAALNMRIKKLAQTL